MVLYIRTSTNYSEEHNDLMVKLLCEEMKNVTAKVIHEEKQFPEYKLLEVACESRTAEEFIMHLEDCDMLMLVTKDSGDPASRFIPVIESV